MPSAGKIPWVSMRVCVCARARMCFADYFVTSDNQFGFKRHSG